MVATGMFKKGGGDERERERDGEYFDCHYGSWVI